MGKKLTKSDKPGMLISKDHANAIEKTEEVGTAMMRSGTQMILAFEEILMSEYKFTEKDIKNIEKKFDAMLKTLYDLKLKGLSVMSNRDMEIVGKLAERWLLEDKANKSGILLGDKKEFIKQLMEPKK